MPHSSIANIEPSVFRRYYENRYEETLEESGLPLSRLLENLNLFSNGQLTLTGLLLFGVQSFSFRRFLESKALALGVFWSPKL